MRHWLLAGCVVVLAGCQTSSDRVPLQRLPENGPPLPYAELLTRARVQATAATGRQSHHGNNGQGDLCRLLHGITVAYCRTPTKIPNRDSRIIGTNGYLGMKVESTPKRL